MTYENSQSVLYDVIASVGNNESKAILFTAMDPGIAYTQTSLHSRHLEIQGDNTVWRTAISVPIGYAATFASVGLVAKETVGSNGSPAYKRTERGNRFVPLAGHLLELSLSEEPSLLAYAGPTNTSSETGVRPNQRRIEIMKLLLANDGTSLRVSDIADKLEIQISHAATISDAMKMYGIVSKVSTGRGKPSLLYMGTPELATITIRKDIGSQFLFDVARVLQDIYITNPNVIFSNEDIANKLVTTYVNVPIGALIKKVAHITNRFTHQRGVLVARREIKDTKIARETISANDEQLGRISRYISAVSGSLEASESYVKTGNEKAEEIVSEPELVRKLIIKAKNNSIGLKGTEDSRQHLLNVIDHILQSAQDPITIREAQDQLELQGVKIDHVTAARFMDELVSLGRVSVDNTKRGRVYVNLDREAEK